MDNEKALIIAAEFLGAMSLLAVAPSQWKHGRLIDWRPAVLCAVAALLPICSLISRAYGRSSSQYRDWSADLGCVPWLVYLFAPAAASFLACTQCKHQSVKPMVLATLASSLGTYLSIIGFAIERERNGPPLPLFGQIPPSLKPGQFELMLPTVPWICAFCWLVSEYQTTAHSPRSRSNIECAATVGSPPDDGISENEAP